MRGELRLKFGYKMGHVGEHYSGNDCVEPVAQVAHFIAFCAAAAAAAAATTTTIGGISGIEKCKVGGEVEFRSAIGCQ